MSPARIGIIGLGVIGKAHFDVLFRASNAMAAAVADPTPEARAFARARGIPAYEDYREMLDRESLDGVVVAVPNAEHVPVSQACVARGIAVLVEKPIAETLEAARLLCDVAARHKVPILVGHHRRHNAVVRRVRQGIGEGLIGRPVVAAVMYDQLKPQSYFSVAWRRDKAAGGPILINLIHEIDLLRFLYGEIVELQALASSATRGFDVEDTAGVLLRFENGAIGTISLTDAAATPFSWDLASGEFDLMAGTAGLARQKVSTHVLGGTHGTLTLPTLHHFSYRGDGEPGWLSELARDTLRIGPAHTYLRQIEHFACVARREAEPLVSGIDGMRTLEATLAVKQAIASGRTVRLAA